MEPPDRRFRLLVSLISWLDCISSILRPSSARLARRNFERLSPFCAALYACLILTLIALRPQFNVFGTILNFEWKVISREVRCAIPMTRRTESASTAEPKDVAKLASSATRSCSNAAKLLE